MSNGRQGVYVVFHRSILDGSHRDESRRKRVKRGVAAFKRNHERAVPVMTAEPFVYCNLRSRSKYFVSVH